MQAAREFVSDVAELVSMPEVYVSIRQLLLRSDTRIDDFVAVVEQDSALSVRVMRMAGSDYFGLPRPCDNLYQAISLIGLVQLHDLMLGSLCIRSFSAVPPELFNLRRFWRYCVRCGIAARTIGQYCRGDGHFVFFTLGLLHEIGHAAMFLKAPDSASELLLQSFEQGRDLAELEHEHFGFDYRDIGRELASIWHLPPVYAEVTAHHLDPAAAESRYRPAVDVIYLAHQLCAEPEDFSRERVARATTGFERFAALPENIGDILGSEVDAHCDDILDLLWPWDGGVHPGFGHA